MHVHISLRKCMYTCRTIHCEQGIELGCQTPSAQTGGEQPQEDTSRFVCRFCHASQRGCYQPGSSGAKASSHSTVTIGRPYRGVQVAVHHPGSTPEQTQTLDELLPSMLQMVQQIRVDEQESVPIFGARNGMRSKRPRQNQQHNSRSDRHKSQSSCHYCGKKGHMESECCTRKQDQQGICTATYDVFAVGASSNDWVNDSSAFKHLSPHRQRLRNYRSMAPNLATTFVNGHQAAAVG